MKVGEKSLLKYSKAQLCRQTADCPHSGHSWGRNTTTFKFLFHSLISWREKDSGKKVDSASYFHVPEPSARSGGVGREGRRREREKQNRNISKREGGVFSPPIQSHICKLLKTKCPYSLGHYIKITFIIFISDTQDPSWIGGRYKNHRQAFLHE